MEMNGILLLSDDKTAVLSVKDKDVKSVIIPDSVTTIGDSAFEGCFSSKSIDIKALYPSARISIFKGMNHGQLLIDNPNEVAKRIIRMQYE